MEAGVLVDLFWMSSTILELPEDDLLPDSHHVRARRARLALHGVTLFPRDAERLGYDIPGGFDSVQLRHRVPKQGAM